MTTTNLPQCRTWHRARACRHLLAALALVLLVSACADKRSPEERAAESRADAIEAIRDTVDGAVRQDQVIALYDEWQTLIGTRHEVIDSRRQQLMAINASYDADRQTFVDFYAQRRDSERAFVAKVLDIRERLRSVVNAQEWDDLDDIRAATQAELPALNQGIQQ